jgi:hypothetical protein
MGWKQTYEAGESKAGKKTDKSKVPLNIGLIISDGKYRLP